MEKSEMDIDVFHPQGRAPAAFNKRSDYVAEEIKRWTVSHGLIPGNRLPKEKEIADWFGCGRGTVREALKALEVQGFVQMRTGPKGGPFLTEPGYSKASDQLCAYLNFKDLKMEDVYEVRLIIEPEMAACVVDVVDDALLDELRESTPCNKVDALSEGAFVRRRELNFHTILAHHCPNPLLGFQSLFINDFLRDHIVTQNPEDETKGEMFDQFTGDNCDYHQKIIDAYRVRSHTQVRSLMREHMQSSMEHTIKSCAKVSSSLLLTPKFKTPI